MSPFHSCNNNIFYCLSKIYMFGVFPIEYKYTGCSISFRREPDKRNRHPHHPRYGRRWYDRSISTTNGRILLKYLKIYVYYLGDICCGLMPPSLVKLLEVCEIFIAARYIITVHGCRLKSNIWMVYQTLDTHLFLQQTFFF